MKKKIARIIIGALAVFSLLLTLTTCTGGEEPISPAPLAEVQNPTTEGIIDPTDSITDPSIAITEPCLATEETTIPETTEEVENDVSDSSNGNNSGSSNSDKPTGPEHTHSYEVKATAPTCTKKGYTTHTCVCGQSYTDTYVNALGHNWSDWVTTQKPTADSEGIAERTCSRCDAKETKALPKLPAEHTHEYTSEVTKEATCTSTGLLTFTCTCGDTYTETIEKTTHKYTATVVNPTCTEEGYTSHICAGCNGGYVDTYVNALGHDFDEWAETKAPTCTEKGEETRTCSRCDATESREIEANGHDYAAVITAPTCTGKGYTTHTYSRCNDRYVDADVDALGHNWGDWVTTQEPTEDSKGTAERICSYCNASETKSLPKLPISHTHEYTSEVTKKATCDSAGIMTYTCSCGDSYTEEIPTTSHMYDTMMTYLPTCVKDGYTVYTCWKCGFETVTNRTPALGHDWSDWVTTQEPTETSEGTAERTCFRCRAKETKSLPSL